MIIKKTSFKRHFLPEAISAKGHLPHYWHNTGPVHLGSRQVTSSGWADKWVHAQPPDTRLQAPLPGGLCFLVQTNTGLWITLGGRSDRKQQAASEAACFRSCWDCETWCQSSSKAINLRMSKCWKLHKIWMIYWRALLLCKGTVINMFFFAEEFQGLAWLNFLPGMWIPGTPAFPLLICQ